MTGTDTGGTDIDSYNVKWDGGVGVWEDLVGQDGAYVVAYEFI